MERLARSDPPQVIVLTAFEQESMVQRLIAMGAVYYMVKRLIILYWRGSVNSAIKTRNT